MMGLVGAFYHAIARNAALDASWENLDKIFSPSCVLNDGLRVHVAQNKLQPIVNISGTLSLHFHAPSLPTHSLQVN